MPKIKSIFLFLIHSSIIWAPSGQSQEKIKGGEEGWKAPEKANYSVGERKETCQRYEGSYIGYYGKVYLVQKCHRRELDEESVSQLGRKKTKILSVESDVIVKLEQGEPIVASQASQSCQKLNNRYIISPMGEMYLMEACKLRVFPDYESYDDHVKSHKLNKSILELGLDEFSTFKKGKPMPTILDSIYNGESIIEQEVDMIPLSEACAGIEGQYVSYYSRVYKIEKCHKREVLDENFHRGLGKRKKIKEISSEQWISLPSGDEIKEP